MPPLHVGLFRVALAFMPALVVAPGFVPPIFRSAPRLGYHFRAMHDYQVFSGRIYKVGLIRYVDVPADVSRSLGQGATHVPVEGEVEGIPLRSTLVSRGKGAYRLAIHSDIRKKLRIDTGAFVEIALRRDEESREPVLPPPLVFAASLAKSAGAFPRHDHRPAPPDRALSHIGQAAKHPRASRS